MNGIIKKCVMVCPVSSWKKEHAHVKPAINLVLILCLIKFHHFTFLNKENKTLAELPEQIR